VRRNPVTILNPLTEEQSVLRTTLVPSLLETVARNLSYQGRDLRLFEVRPVFLPRAGEELPEEKWRLCAVWCGRREAEGWSQQRADVDFFDLKGLAESLLDSFRVEKLGWLAGAEEPFLHPGKSCRIQAGTRALGTLGEVHPRILEGYDIDLPVYLLDLDLEELFAAAGGAGGFMLLSRFPQVCRDSALLVAEAVTAGQVLEVLQAVRTSIVEDFALFDVYQGPGIPEGKKSLAVRVRYRSAERTLTEEDIQRAHDKLLAALGNRLGAEVR
jgi:phenylalanyl-tRNA synthetase beta chain